MVACTWSADPVTKDSDIVKRALGYPYLRPLHSYILKNGRIQRLDAYTPETNRTPVLACGSNAAPEQLIRKFSGIETSEIPVTYTRLDNFVSAYSPHISGYGAIPATLLPMEGASTSCHITWLTPEQLDVMHKSEAVGVNYRYSKLSNINLNCDLTGHHHSIHAYIGRRGYLSFNNQPAVLKEIPFSRSWHNCLPLTQEAVQVKVMHKLTDKINLNRYIVENTDKLIRNSRIEKLQNYREDYPDFQEEILLDKNK
ncbi:hypothetical protein GUA87_08305 [Sneathiella sp. P13V-1]|uniref:hypothetical protein n=1 Tax=Sneathiella sp. P13V-1 TaxID=2697366 RepID=UPI00187B4615|nr:hypothetical protein [Sneathiella sp. P13V-1]MBE7636843.1 hypothetical protein [Sneathiella sp. P13V-1]